MIEKIFNYYFILFKKVREASFILFKLLPRLNETNNSSRTSLLLDTTKIKKIST